MLMERDGVYFVLPRLDHAVTVDMRTISFDIAPQEILTKDSVTIMVDGVVYYRGEVNASRALQKAAAIICENPAALQLRYLQTLTTIAAEKNSTIIFPLPLEILHGFASPK
ncbi:PREDICTED: stomatin-like protein 3 [Thamnophis sirtalis]|uniref:Stomatin-like protein 3 n=1 Tax=Thamnophis sirtalis TaxID=35019 RepID=A0A6I9YMS4_9SAUR|nr:PREDICTED: stomatin-like protein 3 [Thamnophis sirtalis]